MPPLGDKKLLELRKKFMHVKLLIIDEISMVNSTMKPRIFPINPKMNISGAIK